MRKLISTGSPFEKTAGYSRAVVQGDWCFVAGTTGYDYATMTMPESVEAQCRNCLATIGKALAEGGFAEQKQLGQAMKAVQAVVAGRAEGGRVAAEVRRQLAG